MINQIFDFLVSTIVIVGLILAGLVILGVVLGLGVLLSLTALGYFIDWFGAVPL